MTRWIIIISSSVAVALVFVYIGERITDPAPKSNFAESHAKLMRSKGYDLSNNTIPIVEIIPTGIRQGGIPAINSPQYIDANDEEAAINQDSHRVIGVTVNGEARAYPLRILNHHEIVNTEIGDQKYAVTYCPLCDSAAVFDRKTDLGEMQFGVSGMLYNSNVLMYNVKTEEQPIRYLWPQVKAKGTGGKAANYQLDAMPVELTTWGEWKKQHPDTKVLTSDEPYLRNPYDDYFKEEKLKRLVRPLNPALKPKTPILGVWSEKTYRAYQVKPFGENKNRLEDTIEGKKIVLEYIAESNSLRVVEADEGLDWLYSFWFAWAAMNPQTELYESEASDSEETRSATDPQ